MKVLHISTDAQLGGAGIAAYRLHIGLRLLGVDSAMLVSKQRQHDEYIDSPTSNYDKVLARLAPLLERIPKRFSNVSLDLVSPAWVPDRLLSRIDKHIPDIINLHWVNHGFMRIETLSRLRQPVVWTLHDMWPFSGGEHYVGDSIRYMEGYDIKNRPASESGLDINRWVWKKEKEVLVKLEKYCHCGSE